MGEGSGIRSGTGRGLGNQGIRDAQTWPQPSFEANEPPILLMAPKKEKPTGSTSYKIWEPALIAAHMNQVSPASQVTSAQAQGTWRTSAQYCFPGTSRCWTKV